MDQSHNRSPGRSHGGKTFPFRLKAVLNVTVRASTAYRHFFVSRKEQTKSESDTGKTRYGQCGSTRRGWLKGRPGFNRKEVIAFSVFVDISTLKWYRCDLELIMRIK